MRIAEIAPPWYPVPPPGYGGVELVVARLADGLMQLGHDVTLFASGGSRSTAQVVSPMLDPPDPALVGNEWLDALHAVSAYLAIQDDSFDLVHDHSGIAGPALGSLLRGHPPVVHTLHGPWNTLARSYYSVLAAHIHLVAISETQRKANPDVPYAGLVHNGIDVDAYPFVVPKDDFLVYIGRSNPDKGPAFAIEVARRARRPLAMVVKKSEPFERAYWDEIVAPMLHDEVEVYEGVSHECKVDLLGRAQAMLFPIQWPEPFGLVMIEAMACGTPVVTCPVGAAVEVVEEGVTGFLRETVDGLTEAIGAVATCSPYACRARVEARFSASVMVANYEHLFADVVGGAAAVESVSEFPLRR
ncbi:MAG TPA: glycosyltransferase family 4 protein [Acidimicrobiia bacterium]|nr:glycosyltransferase family 4 protein [Acidimicrobiia bacterium]